MSTESEELQSQGVPQLTRLGIAIEVGRMARGLTKQQLARLIGTSRQQLWRVMTGKSDLTGALAVRLGEALEIDPRRLRDGRLPDGFSGGAPIEADGMYSVAPPPVPGPAPSLADLVERREALERALGALPAGDHGRPIKRALLDAIEDAAHGAGLMLPASFFELRREVLNGER